MNRTKLESFDNSEYRPGNKLKIGLWMLFSLIFFQTGFPWPSGVKRGLLKVFGASVGKRVRIKPSVTIKYPWFLSLGSDIWIGENVWIDNLAMVDIRDNACLSQGAMLLTGNHNYSRSSFDLLTEGITLEEGVWIGAKSVVCPGVRCESHAVLSVGSIATKNLKAYTIYAGNPAVPVRERSIS